jgi:hypothetical protein
MIVHRWFSFLVPRCCGTPGRWITAAEGHTCSNRKYLILGTFLGTTSAARRIFRRRRRRRQGRRRLRRTSRRCRLRRRRRGRRWWRVGDWRFTNWRRSHDLDLVTVVTRRCNNLDNTGCVLRLEDALKVACKATPLAPAVLTISTWSASANSLDNPSCSDGSVVVKDVLWWCWLLNEDRRW